MSLNNIKYPKGGTYRSNKLGFEPIDFFLDLLPESKKFDLLLGYFSSTAIRTISKGFALFLFNGGEMRMVTNHIYASDDKQALLLAERSKPEHFEFNLTDYEKIKSSLDDVGTHFFNCLAWLITKKKLQIQIIKPNDTLGIAHYKSGLFDDYENKVSFSGSCNFTYSGLVLNREDITIKKSFTGNEDDLYAIDEFQKEFDIIFSGKSKDLNYIRFAEIEESVQRDFGNKDIYELLEQERTIVKNMYGQNLSDKIKEKLRMLDTKIKNIIDEPRFPYEFPRDYQIKAYEAWKRNNYKGIFAMATGTGKTLTSLNCVLEEYRLSGSYQAIILVPTKELVNQWKTEIKEFNFRNIVIASSVNGNWRNDLRRLAFLSKSESDYSFFVVTTYNTFATPGFQRILKNLPEQTILIADEAHNLGSPSRLKWLEDFSLNRRIGLSATPERIYDEEGSDELDLFFNASRPYTYEFPMKKALEEGYLCDYNYYPILIELQENELEAYVELSKKLSKLINSEDKEIKESAKRLLLLRKQIIHKASNKIVYFKNIIRELSDNNSFKHTLVYAPEGYFNDSDINANSFVDLNPDENRICEYYASSVREVSPETKIALFNGSTPNRDFIINEFTKENIDVLVSMKCLDEGVDVPRTETAIFCASTGNPRQFIQRRGRILRTHKDKDVANIYDLVVVPSKTQIMGNRRTAKQLVENELRRVYEFAHLAKNKYQAIGSMKSIFSIYGINPIY